MVAGLNTEPSRNRFPMIGNLVTPDVPDFRSIQRCLCATNAHDPLAQTASNRPIT